MSRLATPQDVLDGKAQWSCMLGDCLQVMPGFWDRGMDHIITDPPYEAEAHTLQRRTKDAKNGYNGRTEQDGSRGRLPGVTPICFEPITETTRRRSALEMARISRRWIIVFCQAEAAHLWRKAIAGGGAKYKRSMVWTKPDAQPQLTGDCPGMGYETMVVLHTPNRTRWNAGGKVGVYSFNKNSDEQGQLRLHPTQKPIRLMEQLVADFTDPGELVLDPFAGSGTTGVACLRLGRRFIGIERDAGFHQTAVDRLEAESRGQSLREYRAGQLTLFEKQAQRAGGG